MKYTAGYNPKLRKVTYKKNKTNHTGLLFLFLSAFISFLIYSYKEANKPQIFVYPQVYDVETVPNVEMIPVASSSASKKFLLDSTKQPVSKRQKTVYELIQLVWGDDAETGLKIAFCESSYGVNLKHKVSSASGIFMFINSTWIEERKKMGEDQDLDLKLDDLENIKTAYHLFKRQGISPWKASRKCTGLIY